LLQHYSYEKVLPVYLLAVLDVMNCIKYIMQPIKNIRCIYLTAPNFSQLFSCKAFQHENYHVMACQCCLPGCPSIHSL